MGDKGHIFLEDDKVSRNRNPINTERNSTIGVDILDNGLDINFDRIDQGRNNTLDTRRSNSHKSFEDKSEMSRAEFQKQVEALTNTMNNPDLAKSLKDVYSISWENKKMIYVIEKKFAKMMADMLNEYE